MALSTIKTSGSLSAEANEKDIAIVVEDGNDLLRTCAGGCGKKILFFGFPETGIEWSREVEGALCLECRASPLKHTPVQLT